MTPEPRRGQEPPSAPCRTCGQPLAAGKAVCPACGAAHGEANQCPHCHAVADVEPHPALGFRCLVCGGPRLAFDLDGVALGAKSQSELVQAGTEQTKHLMFSAGGLALLGLGGLGLLVAMIVVLAASPGAVPTVAALLGAVVPLAAGAWGLSRAARARTARDGAIARARVAALATVQAVTGTLEAARVASVMRIEPEQAELLLAEASVATFLNEAPAPRVRVEAEAAVSDEHDTTAESAITSTAKDKTELGA